MESILDNIDGAATFLTKYCIILIDYSFNSNKLEDLKKEEKYFFLQDLESMWILKEATAETRLETSFLILSIMSYLLHKRRDL